MLLFKQVNHFFSKWIFTVVAKYLCFYKVIFLNHVLFKNRFSFCYQWFTIFLHAKVRFRNLMIARGEISEWTDIFLTRIC